MIETDKRTRGRWVCPNQCESIDTEATPIGSMLSCPKCGAEAAVVERFEIAAPGRIPELPAGAMVDCGSHILVKRETADTADAPTGTVLLGCDPALPGADRIVRSTIAPTGWEVLDVGARFEPAPVIEEIRRQWEQKFGAKPSDRMAMLNGDIVFRERREDVRRCGANLDHKDSAASTSFALGSPYVTVCAEPGCHWFEVAEYHGMRPPGPSSERGWIELSPRLSGFVIVEDQGATLGGKAKADRLQEVFSEEWGARIVERPLDPTCPDGCNGALRVKSDLRRGSAWLAQCLSCRYEERGTVVDASAAFARGVVAVRLHDEGGENSSPGGAVPRSTDGWTLVRSDRARTRNAVEEALADIGAAFCEEIRAAIIELIDRNGIEALNGLAIRRSDAQRVARGLVYEAAVHVGPHSHGRDHGSWPVQGVAPHRHGVAGLFDDWTITVKEVDPPAGRIAGGFAESFERALRKELGGELTEDSIINRR